MKSHKIISFHPGRQHNLEQAYQISKKFNDYKHLTSLYFDKKKVSFLKSLHPRLAAGISKRSADISGRAVDTYPLAELALLVRRKYKKLSVTDFISRNERFQKWVVRSYIPPKICIGYDTSSWVAFEKWKGKSFLILDLSIAAPQYKLVLAKENDIDSKQIASLTTDDSFLYEIYQKEVALADMVLCGSDFVKKSCISLGANADKLIVLPYGADLKKFHNAEIQPNTRPIKIVFIGSVSYRKGADVLLKAWRIIAKEFTHVELHFYGGIHMEIPETSERVFFHGFLAQENLIAELKSAHISILPSFFEGSSLAIYQSMALGLAVVTTLNAGSVVENNVNGFLIKYGSIDELVKVLKILIENDEIRTSIATKAQQDIQAFTWDRYGEKLNMVLERIVNSL